MTASSTLSTSALRTRRNREAPSATRTEIWQRSGRSIEDLNVVMDVDELVDAALVGFDRREAVTIPSLPDPEQWKAFNGARQAMLPNLAQPHAAERYRI